MKTKQIVTIFAIEPRYFLGSRDNKTEIIKYIKQKVFKFFPIYNYQWLKIFSY